MLTAIQRLQMAGQVSTLMDQQKDAKPMDRISIAIQINDLMTQLGYGQSTVTTDERTPEISPDPAQEPKPAGDETPQIVTDFLAGKFLESTKDGIVAAIKQVSDYLDKFLSLEQVKEQAAQWMDKQGYVFSAQ